MATRYSPAIVTSGLVLCLDAANPRSYSGTGTTWTDLSGNGYNGTLVNSPTFSQGVFTFNGSTNYINVSGVKKWKALLIYFKGKCLFLAFYLLNSTIGINNYHKAKQVIRRLLFKNES